MSDNGDFIKLGEAAAVYGVTVSLLMLRIKNGELPTKRGGFNGRTHFVLPADVESALAWGTCTEIDCESPARGRRGRWCSMHYARFRRSGTTQLRPRPSGPAVANWAGDEVGYKPAHQRVVRAKGKASRYPCQACGKPALDWAYNHQDTEPLTAPDGRLYSGNPEFYMPMCKTCHRRLDVAKRTEAGGWKTHCKHGHEFTPENTAHRRGEGGRICRTCDRDYQRAVQSAYAQRTVCDRGHEMTNEMNTITGRDGRRMCRECHRAVVAPRGVAS